MFDDSIIQKFWMDVSDRKIIEYEKNIFIFRKMHCEKLVNAYYFSDLNQ